MNRNVARFKKQNNELKRINLRYECGFKELNLKVARYENKILLAAEAAIFTSKFVLKLEENIILCPISLWTSFA